MKLPPYPITSPRAAFALTFCVWAAVHASRKSYSAIKPTLLADEWFTFFPTQQHKQYISNSEMVALPDTLFFMFYAISTLWLGKLSDAKDPRFIIALSLAMCSFMLIAFGLGYYLDIHALFVYCFLWALQAFFQALVWPASVAVMGEWFLGHKRSTIMGLWACCNNVGNMIGTGLSELAAVAVGPEEWGASMLLIAGMVALVALLVYVRLTPLPILVGGKAYGIAEEEPTTLPLVLDHDGYAAGSAVAGLQQPLLLEREEEEGEPRLPPPIGMWRALWVDGVLDVSFTYAAIKGCTYAFFFWLPVFLSFTFTMSIKQANLLAMLFDVGQMLGSPAVGWLASRVQLPFTVICLALLLSAIPTYLLSIHYTSRREGRDVEIEDVRVLVGFLLLACGFLSGGPQNLLATSVCQDISQRPGLKGNARAVATVASIVDGIGSIGAGIMQLLIGRLVKCSKNDSEDEDNGATAKETCSFDAVFILLTCGSLVASLCLVRVAVEEFRHRVLRRVAR